MCDSGSDTQVSTSSTEPWSGVQPYLQPGYEAAHGEILNNPLEFYGGSTVTPFHGSTKQGLSVIEDRARQGLGLPSSAQQSAPPGAAFTRGPGNSDPTVGMLGHLQPTLSQDEINAARAETDANGWSLSQIGGSMPSEVINTRSGLGAQAGSAPQFPGAQTMSTAQNQIQNTLGGAFLGQGNPYMDAVTQRIAGDARNMVDSEFAGSGRYGSGMHSQMQARGIADAIAPLAFQNYENERNRQMGALNLAPDFGAQDYINAQQLIGAGGMREAQAGKELQDQIARWDFAQQEPYQRIPAYQAAIQGGNVGGVTTSTMPSQSGNPLLTALGVGATGIGMANGLWGGANPLFNKPF